MTTGVRPNSWQDRWLNRLRQKFPNCKVKAELEVDMFLGYRCVIYRSEEEWFAFSLDISPHHQCRQNRVRYRESCEGELEKIVSGWN